MTDHDSTAHADRRPRPSLSARMLVVTGLGALGLAWAALDLTVGPDEPPWQLVLVAALLIPALVVEFPLRLGERRVQVAGLFESAYLLSLVLMPRGWLVALVAGTVLVRDLPRRRGFARCVVGAAAWVAPVALGTAVYAALSPAGPLQLVVCLLCAVALVVLGNEVLVSWLVAGAGGERLGAVLREDAATTALGFAGNVVVGLAVLGAVAGERWELVVVGPVLLAWAVHRYRARLRHDTTTDALPRLRDAARRIEALDEDLAFAEVLDRAAALFAVERVQLVLLDWPGRGDQTRVRSGPGAVEVVRGRPGDEPGPRDLAAPLLSSGPGAEVLLGELRLTFSRPPALSEAEHDVWRTFAATTSAALGHTRSYAEQVRQARVDALTGLPNRLALTERLEALLPGVLDAHAADPAGAPSVAVLLLDLDHFKEVNDSLGHSAGDCLLRQLAERLGAALRPGDLAVRLGGDEFGVLLPGVRSGRDALAVAEKLLAVINTPVSVEGLELPVEASIGVALAPRDGTSVETLLAGADVAMYRAKTKRNSAVVYDPALDPSGEQGLRLVAELQTALREEHLVVHYQPIVSLRTGELHGAEALVRWQHPTRGLLGPGHFIPAVERTSLILPLTLAVLDRAVADAVTWTEPGGPERSVSVNLSPRCLLVRSLPGQVVRILAAHGLPARRLTLEITETIALVDLDVVDEVLTALRDLGVGLSVDDFGTGYSSMSFLRKVAVDEVKVDRSFVTGAATTPGDRAIVQATVALAHGLGLTVVGEGVETRAQLQLLRDVGCDTAQGYLLGRPVPLVDLVRMLGRPDPAVRAMLGAEQVAPAQRGPTPEAAVP